MTAGGAVPAARAHSVAACWIWRRPERSHALTRWRHGWEPGLAGSAPGANPPSGLSGIMQNVGARVAMSGGTGSGILNTLKHIPGVGLGLDLIEGVQN
jgi:hypothetical protein